MQKMTRTWILSFWLCVVAGHLSADVAVLFPDASRARHHFAPAPDGRLVLGPGALAQSVRSFGDPAMFAGARAKLSQGRCPRFVVLGGSISCGHGAGNTSLPTWPSGRGDAWPALFARLLKEAYKCEPELDNLCVPGQGSVFWTDRVSGWMRAPDHPILRADVVLVETAHNDIEYAAGRDAHLVYDEKVEAYNELLLGLLLRLPNKPAVAYVAASTRTMAWASRADDRLDTTRQQTAVARHYDVALVSAVDGLGPFGTPARAAWFRDVFLFDVFGHPSKFGHAVVARLCANHFFNVIWALDLAPPDRPYAPPPRGLRVDKADVDLYADAHPLRISAEDFKDARRWAGVRQSGWEVRADKPGKPVGFLAFAAGSAITFDVSPADVAEHALAGALRIHYLKSYEHMGSFAVLVRADNSTLARASADGLWHDGSSLTRVLEVRFEVKPVVQALHIELRVEERGRAENKVKITELFLL